MFRGSDVCDESHFLARFQDLGSAPASMSSGKSLDFLGLRPGRVLMQADALRAYAQALLGRGNVGTSTSGPVAEGMGEHEGHRVSF